MKNIMQCNCAFYLDLTPHFTRECGSLPSFQDRITPLMRREITNMSAAYGATVGRELPFETVQRRTGDVGSSVACPVKANEAHNWSATLSVHDATSASWNWQSQNPDEYVS